ncbi:chitinase-3-like protein 1 [Ornithodoros turicata]|uniref:chitinase-3-like protein 1 n=1 Tax=Ornithodoros turicata TaxID=34597 RepID=UPI00313A2C35
MGDDKGKKTPMQTGYVYTAGNQDNVGRVRRRSSGTERYRRTDRRVQGKGYPTELERAEYVPRRKSVGEFDTEDKDAKTIEQELMHKIAQEDPDAAKQLRALYPEQNIETEGNAGAQEAPPLNGSPPGKAMDKCVDAECAAVVLLLNLAAICIIVIVVLFVGSTLDRDDPRRGDRDKFKNRTETTVQDEDDNIRTQIFYNVSYSATAYTHPHHTAVCVYHVGSQGIMAFGSMYGLPMFPYPFCHLALYCCITANKRMELVSRGFEMDAFKEFSLLVRQNKVAKVGVVVGAPGEEAMLQQLLGSWKARSAFIENAVRWSETNEYDAIYLYWRDPSGVNKKNAIEMLRHIVSGFNDSGRHILLGVVLTLRAVKQAETMDLDKHLFEKSSVMILPPPVYKTIDSAHRRVYYNVKTIDDLSALKGANGDQVCVLFPAGASTSTGASELGPPGNFTRTPGRMAYYEACHATSRCKTAETAFSVQSTCGRTLYSYASVDSLKRFTCALESTLDVGCVGFWQTEMDDFTGTCGIGDFPLTKALFDVSTCDLT